MAEIKPDTMVTHKSDPRPMLVVSVRDGECVCKFPGKEEYRTFASEELKVYKPSGPMKPIF
jgi:hypothetical protein